MPSELVFDPVTFAFLLALFALLGALCAYLGAKVWDDDPISRIGELSALWRQNINDRFKKTDHRLHHLEHWKRRFVAHHNRDHAAKAAAQEGYLSPQALQDHLNSIFTHVERHNKAIADLIAANGDMNGLKAFVDAIHAVQNKQEDRLATLERARGLDLTASGEMDRRLGAIERKSGPRKSGR